MSVGTLNCTILVYAAKPYTEEAAFVHFELAAVGTAAPRRLLELRADWIHALALEKLDTRSLRRIIQKTCSRARHKAAQHRPRRFPLSKISPRIWRSVLSTQSFAYSIRLLVTTNDKLHQCSRTYYAIWTRRFFHLRFWHAGAMLKNHEPVRVRRGPPEARCSAFLKRR